MIRTSKPSENGDTLIEVLVAIAILSIVIVTSQAIMNHGLSLALRSVERTTTQGELNSQFSYLRYARDSYVADPSSNGGVMWSQIASKATTGGSTATVCDTSNQRPYKETNMFYIDEAVALSATTDFTTTVKAYTMSGPSALPVPAEGRAKPGAGIWIVAREAGATEVPYIDFYAKACWSSLIGTPMEQLTSIMRLYVPAP